jgi:hypothetical protein
MRNRHLIALGGLARLARRLNYKYLLTFLAIPKKKPGLQRIKVSTELPNVELVPSAKVYVPGVS